LVSNAGGHVFMIDAVTGEELASLQSGYWPHAIADSIGATPGLSHRSLFTHSLSLSFSLSLSLLAADVCVAGMVAAEEEGRHTTRRQTLRPPPLSSRRATPAPARAASAF
jgi:hypothetical protein